MYERLVPPDEYTEDIKEAIAEIKKRMDYGLIKYTDGQIKVFEYGDSVYVLANPILGEDYIYNEETGSWETVPLHNITLIYPQNWIIVENNEIKWKRPKIRIIRPELCKRIIYKSDWVKPLVSRDG